MIRFFDRLRWSISRFMAGRYGFDKLSQDVTIVALVFWFLSLFGFRWVFMLLYELCFLFVFFRAFSRNIYKRQRELTKYFAFREKMGRKQALIKQRRCDRKTHRYFKCTCGQMLRVPKGKGKIKIHCALCGKEMIKKT